ncbi:MAG TPA: OsmC family protein [Gemmatimonadaceae bacterium]|nr:OsmC family protein [Gemmatimonadaceae bacterium]
MAPHTHAYTVRIRWTGNLGEGTRRYLGYSRDHEISADGKGRIPGSSDPLFRGDAARYNPEELLVSSLSTCHMLWYLHLCADAGVVVTSYDDQARGTMEEAADGSGRFSEVVLAPDVIVAPGSDPARAVTLHDQAHAMCFVARSVNFPVRCEPRVRVASS